MDWHGETLILHDVYEKDIPYIKENDPARYERILHTEFMLCCEDRHLALYYPKWVKENNL